MVGRTSRVTKAPTRFQDDEDFYLIKFEEDGVRRVLSRDKVRIEDEAVEAGATCQAYWEDSQIKGWFSAIILAFGDSYENLLKTMNQKKRKQNNQDSQVEPKPKKAKKTNQQKQATTGNISQRKKGTEQDENDENRKEQEREVKRKKKEEEKKKREAKQKQRKEQLLALQKRHRSSSQQHRLSAEEASDSDDEYQPVYVDESSSTDSEPEDSVARKQPRKNRSTQQQSILTSTLHGSSPRASPSCTRQLPAANPPLCSTNLSFTPSPTNNSQDRQVHLTKLGCSTSSNVNSHRRLILPANPSHTTSRPSYPHHTPFDSANSGDSFSPTSHQNTSSPSATHDHDHMPSSVNPRYTPTCTPASQVNPHCVPSPSVNIDRIQLPNDSHYTPSPSANLECMPSSLNRRRTPSPPANSGNHAHNTAEEVDWQDEYQKLRIKYNALKDKIRLLEQSSQGEYASEERPRPGIYTPSEAQKYKMIEVCPGSGVYWYLGNRNTALNNTKTAGELTAFMMDTFFNKEVMAVSNMNGGGTKGYQKLNPTIINAMRGFVQDEGQYGKQAAMAFNKTVQDKCCGARRGISKGLNI